MLKEFGNPFLEKGQNLMFVDMDDTVGKQLKQLVRIKRFQWLKKCEKPSESQSTIINC